MDEPVTYLCFHCRREFNKEQLTEVVAPYRELSSVYYLCPECRRPRFKPCLHRFAKNGICRYCGKVKEGILPGEVQTKLF